MIRCALGQKNNIKKRGFTIIELLVVIVIIGILALICWIAYNGITKQAVKATVQSDASSLSNLLANANTEYGSYPSSIDESQQCVESDTVMCFDPSPDNHVEIFDDGNELRSYCLINQHYDDLGVCVNDIIDDPTQKPIEQPSSCPTGFIPVPGSVTYFQGGFCVMKYEARKSSETVPVSNYNSETFVNVSQAEAEEYSKNVVGCDNCHLISESEWLTIAQNVMSVNSNWTDNEVGGGQMFYGINSLIGSNGGQPFSPDIDASLDDNDIKYYLGDANALPATLQRRTLKLSNSQTIWDFSGLFGEWTSGKSLKQALPGIAGSDSDSVNKFVNYDQITVNENNFISIFPSYADLNNIDDSDSIIKSIGGILVHTSIDGEYGFVRGNTYQVGLTFNDTSNDRLKAGVLGLSFEPVELQSNAIGFRVAMTP